MNNSYFNIKQYLPEIQKKNMSYSFIKSLKVSIDNALQMMLTPFEPSDAFIFGDAFDNLLLTPEKFEKEFVVIPAGTNKKTKAGKEIYAQAETEACNVKNIKYKKRIIKEETVRDILDNMIPRAMSHPTLKHILNHPDVSFQDWIEKFDHRNNTFLGKYDIAVINHKKKLVTVVDVKTIGEYPVLKKCKQQIADYGYYIQRWIYTKAFQIQYPDYEIDYIYSFHQKNAPYDIHMIRADRDSFLLAELEINVLCDIWNDFKKNPLTYYCGIQHDITEGVSIENNLKWQVDNPAVAERKDPKAKLSFAEEQKYGVIELSEQQLRAIDNAKLKIEIKKEKTDDNSTGTTKTTKIAISKNDRKTPTDNSTGVQNEVGLHTVQPQLVEGEKATISSGELSDEKTRGTVVTIGEQSGTTGKSVKQTDSKDREGNTDSGNNAVEQKKQTGEVATKSYEKRETKKEDKIQECESEKQSENIESAQSEKAKTEQSGTVLKFSEDFPVAMRKKLINTIQNKFSACPEREGGVLMPGDFQAWVLKNLPDYCELLTKELTSEAKREVLMIIKAVEGIKAVEKKNAV